jgi:hypothetical protein
VHPFTRLERLGVLIDAISLWGAKPYKSMIFAAHNEAPLVSLYIPGMRKA